MRRAVSIGLVTGVVCAVLGPGVSNAQDLPPSLQGEAFLAIQQPTNIFGEVDIASSCTATVGETFTMNYSASGPAFGPYPGTFTESGTATVTLTAPDFFPGTASGVVINWTANFAIDSPVGQVTGTKTFSATTAAVCFHNFGVFFSPTTFVDDEAAHAQLNYRATIRTTDGTFTDHGDALVQLAKGCAGLVQGACDIQDEEVFVESFTLSRGVLPLDTTGKATGGGQLGDITSPSHLTFGFEVKKNERQVLGRCVVADSAHQTWVKCLTVTDYQQVGNTATWQGMAEVNGVAEHYRITVQDNGEPNRGVDVFSIETETFEAAGNVRYGNIQVHTDDVGL